MRNSARSCRQPASAGTDVRASGSRHTGIGDTLGWASNSQPRVCRRPFPEPGGGHLILRENDRTRGGRARRARGAASVNGPTQDGNRADLEAANRGRDLSRDTDMDVLKDDVADRDVDETVLPLGGGTRRGRDTRHDDAPRNQ